MRHDAEQVGPNSPPCLRAGARFIEAFRIEGVPNRLRDVLDNLHEEREGPEV